MAAILSQPQCVKPLLICPNETKIYHMLNIYTKTNHKIWKKLHLYWKNYIYQWEKFVFSVYWEKNFYCKWHNSAKRMTYRSSCIMNEAWNMLASDKCHHMPRTYHQVSNIIGTKSQNLSHLAVVFAQYIKVEKKMYLEQRRQMMLQLHLSDQQFYCLRCGLY